MMGEPTGMPVGNKPAFANDVFPFSLFNEEQARRNHGQSLRRLAERGGLSWCEAAAIIERREWRAMDDAEAERIVRAALAALKASGEE
jgi:hypothetical protein